MEHDVVRTECGFTWTTRDKAGLHEHVCRRETGHATTWHACTADGATSHVVERRAALTGSAA